MNDTGVTKSQFVERIANRQELPVPVARQIVDLLLGAITEQLVHGGRVEIRGFGVFEVRWRPARQCRNPSTGEVFFSPQKPYPKFRASRFLTKAADPNESATF